MSNDSEMSNPRKFVSVMELETIYSDLLKSDNFRLLVKYLRSLNKKTTNKRVSVFVFFDTAAVGLNTSSETYFNNLVRLMDQSEKQ